ncbi:MAG: hypothetical protein IKU00_01525 [Bacteroidales bacterium]|nr:hypothetical protein [Bacteroidales bacterium]
MKRILILLSVFLLALNGIAQDKAKYSENDVKQFYRTIQGDYTGQISDSTMLSIHFTPIWESEQDPFRWFYLEATEQKTNRVVTQKVLEIIPLTDISFQIVVHNLKSPQAFVGKWSNRNFFDGYNTGILKGKKKFTFLKTKDFEYQTSWYKRKSFDCFPSGDRIHFKFSQEDERLYIKRVPSKSSHIIGYTFFKALTD